VIVGAVNWEAVGAWAGVVGVVLAVAAIIVSVGLYRAQAGGQRKAEQLQDDQRAALVRLLEIEEGRAAKETRQQLEDYRLALEVRQASKAAKLTVERRRFPAQKGKGVVIHNHGPAAALLTSVVVESNPESFPRVTETPLAEERSLPAGEQADLSLTMILGPATVTTQWRDDRDGLQTQTDEVDFEERNIVVRPSRGRDR
jgi:hypothetical protein